MERKMKTIGDASLVMKLMNETKKANERVVNLSNETWSQDKQYHLPWLMRKEQSSKADNKKEYDQSWTWSLERKASKKEQNDQRKT